MYKFKKGYYTDIRIEKRFTTNIFYRNQVLESSKCLNTKSAFIRLFDGEMCLITKNVLKLLKLLHGAPF